jgi:hypothetical protein
MWANSLSHHFDEITQKAFDGLVSHVNLLVCRRYFVLLMQDTWVVLCNRDDDARALLHGQSQGYRESGPCRYRIPG